MCCAVSQEDAGLLGFLGVWEGSLGTRRGLGLGGAGAGLPYKRSGPTNIHGTQQPPLVATNLSAPHRLTLSLLSGSPTDPCLSRKVGEGREPREEGKGGAEMVATSTDPPFPCGSCSTPVMQGIACAKQAPRSASHLQCSVLHAPRSATASQRISPAFHQRHGTAPSCVHRQWRDCGARPGPRAATMALDHR